MLSRDMVDMRCRAYVERCGGVDPIGQIEHVYYAGLLRTLHMSRKLACMGEERPYRSNY